MPAIYSRKHWDAILTTNFMGFKSNSCIPTDGRSTQYIKNSSNQRLIKCHRNSNNFLSRLQNSPNFCVFKNARAVKQKVWNDAENRERDWGETLKIINNSLASHALRTCEARALRARKILTPPFTDFFTDFEKKTDCFAVYFLSAFTWF